MASYGAGGDPRKNNNMASSGAKDKPPVAVKPATHRGAPIQQRNNESSTSQAPHPSWSRWSNADPVQQWRPTVSQSSQVSSRMVQRQGSEGTPLARSHQPSFQQMQPAPSNPHIQGSTHTRYPSTFPAQMQNAPSQWPPVSQYHQPSYPSMQPAPSNPPQQGAQSYPSTSSVSTQKAPSTVVPDFVKTASQGAQSQLDPQQGESLPPLDASASHSHSRDRNFISELEKTYGKAASSVAARATQQNSSSYTRIPNPVQAMQQQSNPYTLRSNQQQLASINRQVSRGAAIVPTQATQPQLAPMYHQNYPAGPSATQAMQQQSIPGYTRGPVEELESALEQLALLHGRPHSLCAETIRQLEQQIEEAEAENHTLRMNIENEIRKNGPIRATMEPKKKTDEGDQEGV